MSTHPAYEELNDWIDGILAPDQAQVITAHCAVCDECAAMTASLRQLLSESAALPKTMPVPAEIWDGVAAATVARRANRKQALWQLRYPLAAAATFLIAMTAAVTLLLSRGNDKPVAVTRVVPAPQCNWPCNARKRITARVCVRWRPLLGARRAQLDPATVKMLDQHLTLIDSAIRDAKAALIQNPDNKALPHMIYRRLRTKDKHADARTALIERHIDMRHSERENMRAWEHAIRVILVWVAFMASRNTVGRAARRPAHCCAGRRNHYGRESLGSIEVVGSGREDISVPLARDLDRELEIKIDGRQIRIEARTVHMLVRCTFEHPVERTQ
jgi:hypothetical protein